MNELIEFIKGAIIAVFGIWFLLLLANAMKNTPGFSSSIIYVGVVLIILGVISAGLALSSKR